MSSISKDPLEKQDTSSGTSESDSDSDVEKAEENLEHLKIEECLEKGASKDDLDESKPLDSPNKEGTLTSQCDLINEPTAGPRGLEEPRLGSSDGNLDPESKDVGCTGRQKEKEVETKDVKEIIGAKMLEGESSATSEKDEELKGTDEDIGARMEEGDSNTTISTPTFLQSSTGATPTSMLEDVSSTTSENDEELKRIDENIRARMEEGDSDTTSSTPPFVQSSTGATPTSMLDDYSSAPPRRLERYIDLFKMARNFPACPKKKDTRSSSSRRFAYATDSASTSADVSEIRSEIADSSAEGSEYQDAPENFEKEQTPSYASAVESQSSEETSETNISEIQDEYIPPPTEESSSVSTSTPSGEQGNRAYLARLQREAETRRVPISTSSGIGSTNQSELAHLQAWHMAGEIGYHRNNADDPNRDAPHHGARGCEPLPASESMDAELIFREQQEFDRLSEQQRQNENIEQNMSADALRGSVAIPIEKGDQVCEVGAGSPSKRRRPSKCLSDSSGTGKGVVEKQRPKFKPDAGKRSKMVASKSSPALQYSSESPEPKSSSSDELHRKESPDIKSSSESEKGRKLWQKPGLLRSMQLSTISKDSVIPEEEEDRSSLREQDPEAVKIKDDTLEEMLTTSEKDGKGPTQDAEPSESKPSVSSDQAEGEGTSIAHAASFDVPEFERSVGKSKREPKLSSSPPSDENLESSPESGAASRPTKKARPDVVPEKTRRTRHDSGSTVPKSFSHGDLQESESTSTPDISDYTPSDEEKETAF